MATRLYMTAAAAPVTPSGTNVYGAAGTQVWELPATGSAPTANLLARAGAWPGATAFATVTSVAEISTTNAQDVCSRRFVSDPLLGAQTIAGQLNGQMKIGESATQANALPQIMVKVCSNDGTTLRGTLYGGDSRTTNVDELPTTQGNVRIPAAGISPVTLSSVSAQDGDRIVIEVGARGNNTSATSFTHNIRHGSLASYGGANDHAVGGSETTDLNPWVEFTQDLLFSNAGVVWPPKQYVIWI